jgi:hypothetical protein
MPKQNHQRLRRKGNGRKLNRGKGRGRNEAVLKKEAAEWAKVNGL